MQDQIARVVKDIQNVMRRFPEFEEVSLGMTTVSYFTDAGHTIAACEPSLLARERDGDWLDCERSADLLTIHNLLDWGPETCALLDNIGLRSRAVVFTRDDARPELMMQQLVDRTEQRNTSSSPAGM